MYDNEAYPADWRVSFAPFVNLASALSILNSCLICKWAWENFLWNLPLLHRLLVERPATYDYLYVTRFLKARAAYWGGKWPKPLRPTEKLAAATDELAKAA